MAIMDKPLVLKKARRFLKKYKQNGNRLGHIPCNVIIDYNNRCNLNCAFCYERDQQKKYGKEKLSFELLRDLANQADRLGIFQIEIQGGELLIDPESMYELIRSLGADRFEISLISNGYLMTQKIADKLAELGVDNVGISLSSFDAEEHDSSRGRIGSHARALQAIEYVKNAGMFNWPNAIVSHENINDPKFEEFLSKMTNEGALVFLNFSMPYGEWNNNENVIMTADDMKKLQYFREKYNCNMDWWDQYDRKKQGIRGCSCVNRVFLTPLGDVLVCPFIHISLGNIKERSLKDILDYGFSIKWFGENVDHCLAAQDKVFRDKYLEEEHDIFRPYLASEIFSEDDYIKKEEIG